MDRHGSDLEHKGGAVSSFLFRLRKILKLSLTAMSDLYWKYLVSFHIPRIILGVLWTDEVRREGKSDLLMFNCDGYGLTSSNSVSFSSSVKQTSP